MKSSKGQKKNNKKGTGNNQSNKSQVNKTPNKNEDTGNKAALELDSANNTSQSKPQQSPPELSTNDDIDRWDESDECINKFNEAVSLKKEEMASSGQKSKNKNVTRQHDKKPKVERNLSVDDYYRNHWKTKRSAEDYVVVKEIECDLFQMDEKYALAHCVAEDMNMGSGIAVNFRTTYGKDADLMDQRAKQGNIAVLEVNGRYIYYLVTKRESNGKPTLETMYKSLIHLQAHMVKNAVLHLAIPRLGCGLDRLEWTHVKNMLEYIFTDTDIEIVVCNFQKADEVMQESVKNHRSRKCKVVSYYKPMTDIDKFTMILYIGTEDAYVSPEMLALDEKYRFLKDYRSHGKKLGETVCTYTRNNEYLLYGCIAKKSMNANFQYAKFKECISAINKENVKKQAKGECYEYVGVPYFNEKNDDLFMAKITNLIRNTFYGVHVYINEG